MEATRWFMCELSRYRQTLPEDMRPTWANITTITMVARANKPLNPDIMRKVFNRLKVLPVHRQGCQEPNNWRLFHSDFYNQVSIGYQDSLSTKKVKIFPNGALQIAGCADLIDCKNFTKQLCLIIKLIYDVEIQETDFKIVMINSNFALNHTIDLYRTVEIFGDRVTFDPDRYSAVKIKYKPLQKDITTSIFASGAVIITGANCIEDILETYKFIVERCVQGRVFVGLNDQTVKFQKLLGFRV